MDRSRDIEEVIIVTDSRSYMSGYTFHRLSQPIASHSPPQSFMAPRGFPTFCNRRSASIVFVLKVFLPALRSSLFRSQQILVYGLSFSCKSCVVSTPTALSALTFLFFNLRSTLSSSGGSWSWSWFWSCCSSSSSALISFCLNSS